MNGGSLRAARMVSFWVTAIFLGASVANAQLTPPQGPVSTSMKRLDQIEPRRIVNSLAGSDTAVHLIDQPGVYVVTADIRGLPGKSGIEITCDGSVVLDLNGFSLDGVPGSLHGVVVRDRPSGQSTGQRTFTSGRFALEVNGRISSWGGDGMNISDVDVCDIGGLTITDCGGAACRVVSHHHCMCIISNIRARTCGGGGVDVDVSGPVQGATGLGVGKVSMSDLSVMRCTGGSGVHVSTDSGGTCDVTITRSSVADSSSHGVHVEAVGAGGGLGTGKVSMSDLSVMRCAGDGVRCECASGWAGPECSVVRVAVGDVNGDGIHLLGWSGDCSGSSADRCAGAGLHCEGSSVPFPSCKVSISSFNFCLRGVDVSSFSQLHLDGVTCSSCTQEGFHIEGGDITYIGACDASFCGGDGISVISVLKFKAGSDLAQTVNKGCSITACGGNGLHIVDCPDASSSSLDVSLCSLDGILHEWTTPPTSARLAHEAAHVVQNGGGGLRVTCPSSTVALEVSARRCTFSSNIGSGLSIERPGTGILGVDIVDMRCAFNGGNGVEVRASATSSVSCTCSHLRCVGNGGDGVSMTCIDRALTLTGGSLHLESSVCSSNVGSGCQCDCPVDMTSTRLSGNGLFGLDIRVGSPFDSAGSMTGCTVHQNASHGMRCGPGRFSGLACDVADNGGDGLHLESGCLVLDSTVCNRNGGDGVSVVGTLTITGGASRRNGGAGIRCSDGTCAIAECVAELNGSNPAVTGGGMLFTDCSSVSLHRCVASNNTGPGMACGSSSGVSCTWSSVDCVCSSNSLAGMSLSNCVGGQVLRCVLSGHSGGRGLECLSTFTGGKIEACSCTGNAGGILVEGLGNLVISNSCTFGPLGAFSVVQPGNAVGRIIDSGAMQQSCDPRANIQY